MGAGRLRVRTRRGGGGQEGGSWGVRRRFAGGTAPCRRRRARRTRRAKVDGRARAGARVVARHRPHVKHDGGEKGTDDGDDGHLDEVHRAIRRHARQRAPSAHRREHEGDERRDGVGRRRVPERLRPGEGGGGGGEGGGSAAGRGRPTNPPPPGAAEGRRLLTVPKAAVTVSMATVAMRPSLGPLMTGRMNWRIWYSSHVFMKNAHASTAQMAKGRRTEPSWAPPLAAMAMAKACVPTMPVFTASQPCGSLVGGAAGGEARECTGGAVGRGECGRRAKPEWRCGPPALRQRLTWSNKSPSGDEAPMRRACGEDTRR